KHGPLAFRRKVVSIHEVWKLHIEERKLSLSPFFSPVLYQGGLQLCIFFSPCCVGLTLVPQKSLNRIIDHRRYHRIVQGCGLVLHSEPCPAATWHKNLTDFVLPISFEINGITAGKKIIWFVGDESSFTSLVGYSHNE